MLNLQFGVNMKKVVIYTRVSTDKQTVENQVKELTEYCKRCNFEIVKIYRDEGISGTKGRDERSGLDEMMKDAVHHKFDMLLCYSICRLSRSLKELITIMNTLNELKIDMFFSVQSIDTTTSAGKMIFNIFGSLAEFERELLRERIKSGINRAREQGKKLGRKTKINESLVTAVRLLRDRDMSIKNISKELNIGIGTIYKIL